MIFAHSDDELLTLSYVAKLKEQYPTKSIHWILVTNSGEGWVFPTACGLKTAAECRIQEAREVSRCVGIKNPYEMNLGDGELKKVKNLESRLEKVIKKLTVEKVGAVLTSDVTGVYGHPDHLAVHDAMKAVATKNAWPMITGALPKAFRERIKLRESGKGRIDPAVTHVVRFSESIKDKLVCATNAHESQKFMLWFMRQKLSARDFIEKIPYQFFHLY